ncbi:hypothetical protein NL676_031647 [Syzygium grande]|nr:hypothetical protein NL676_031647 [Syzygium grande]
MDNQNPEPPRRSAQRLPPKRGQIKINILRSIIRSARALASTAPSAGEEQREDGGFASTSSGSPIQSGYSSGS